MVHPTDGEVLGHRAVGDGFGPQTLTSFSSGGLHQSIPEPHLLELGVQDYAHPPPPPRFAYFHMHNSLNKWKLAPPYLGKRTRATPHFSVDLRYC